MTTPKGIVAAGHPITASAAAEILEEGGNAFDAIVAGLFTACVPELVLASPGGGGFMMAHVASRRRNILYDFFSHAPITKQSEKDIDFRAIRADFGPATQDFHIGAGSAATPGFVPGLAAIHDELCRLPWRRLIEPTIKVAREGVEISAFHAYLFSVIKPILLASKETSALYAPSGKLLETGERFTNEALADAFEALAYENARLFTEGEVARSMVEQSVQQGGHLTLDDLRRYKVARRDPISWDLPQHKLYLNPPPAASGALIAFGLDLAKKKGVANRVEPLTLISILAQTNRARAEMGENTRKLLDATTVAHYFKLMSGHKPANRGTTHVSVIDAEGNAAAATISNGEGNGLIVDGCGFMLNNMLGEEDLNPTGFHSWQSGKRLSSMMAPTIMENANGALTAMGSGGSNRIRTAILQVTLNLLSGMRIEQAVYAPRIHLEKCGTLSFEDDLSEHDRNTLLKAFPDAKIWPERNMFFGGVHAAHRNNLSSFEGSGDPRRGGVVVTV